MTWLRVDDNAFEHPKLADLSDAAFRAVCRSWGYASRLQTDGFLPASVAREFCGGRRPIVEQIVDGGCWEQNGSGLWVHDYLDWNPSREEISASREQDARRKRRPRGGHA